MAGLTLRLTQEKKHMTKPSSKNRIGLTRALFLPIIASGLLLVGCDSIGPKAHDHRTMQVAAVDFSPIDITNANGWIEAIQADRADVGIDVELYGHDIERLFSATVHADRMGDETLRVWIEWPGGKRRDGEGANISLLIPNCNGINARTTNGHITVEGLSGDAQLNSSNGSIRVSRYDGSVNADTSNGRIQLEGVSGDIEVYSSNGRVIITDAFGQIRAETTNGNAYITTMDGNAGPIRVRTSNGRIDLDLGDGFEGILRCQTSNGKVQVDGIEHANLIHSTQQNHNTTSVEMQVGDSDTVSALRTSNGSIRVRSRHAVPADD